MNKDTEMHSLRKQVFQGDYRGDLESFLAGLDSLGDVNVYPEELKASLEIVIKSIELKEEEAHGLKIVFPEGFKLQTTDVGGYRVVDVLRNMIVQLANYEPPIMRQAEEQEEIKTEVAEGPELLRGYEGLVWKKPSKNPMWEIEATSYGEETKLVYKRRNQTLEAGKPESQQNIPLKNVKHYFTRLEWLVIEPLVLDYLKTELAMREGPEELSKTARRKILDILKEENQFRGGKTDEIPQILRGHLEDSIKKTAKLKRWNAKQTQDMLERLDEMASQVGDILSQLVVLNANRLDGKKMIPEADRSIKETPTFVSSMKNLLDCFEFQLGEGQGGTPKGFSLLLGEPGVGKNELVKYLATKLNRPYFWFPCGRGMEAVDLIHHYEFDSKEGTKKFFTSLAEGLQTPGAIVFIDEANALKPQVQAILHGAGDSNRTVRYDGIEIPIAEGVIVVLGGNPATQGSAGNFGEPILSRSRGQAMIMNYPSLKRSDLVQIEEKLTDTQRIERETVDNSLRNYMCDEVLALYGSIGELSDYNDLEFEYLWERIVNEAPVLMDEKFGSVNKVDLDKIIEEDVRQGNRLRHKMLALRDILRVADLWRKKFEKRDVMIGVSLRDTIAVVQAFKKTGDVRKAYLNVFDDFRKNPIDGLDVMYVDMLQILDSVLSGGEFA